jgi:putative transposase
MESLGSPCDAEYGVAWLAMRLAEGLKSFSMEDEAPFSHQPHRPPHLFLAKSVYFVTAGTYEKKALFDCPTKLDFLTGVLFEQVSRWKWQLEAWAVMPNHYHFVARAPEDPHTLKSLIRSLHSKSANWINQVDGTIGRKVWYQYWDTCLTHEKSYLARLNYVHHNPVKHSLAERAEDYPWCSMAWFLDQADSEFVQKVAETPSDRINVRDDY